MNEQRQEYTDLKLYMLLLGSKAPGRHVEQHDFFFGVATTLKELVPEIKTFWPEAGNGLHIDGWREVKNVDGYKIKVVLKEKAAFSSPHKLFFINLGGYQADKLEEQHYIIIIVKEDRALAVNDAKKTVFFKTTPSSHIDDKYGIDVDDVYNIEEMLTLAQKEKYHIEITPFSGLTEDEIHLGYFKLDNLS